VPAMHQERRQPTGRVYRVNGTSTAEAPHTCACGCGQKPKTKGSRYLRGHQWTVPANIQARGPTRAFVEGTCAQCGASFSYRPRTDREQQRIYCSTDHRDKARRPWLRQPPNEFGRFLHSEWRQSEKSVLAYSRDLGISRDALRGMLGGRMPAESSVAKLRVVFGDRLPATVTVNEVHREYARLNLHGIKLAHTPEAIAKNAAARRGRKQSPEWIAAREASRLSSPAGRASIARMVQRMQSPEGRAVGSLLRRLKVDATPTAATLEAWANINAARLNLTREAVMTLWRPTLVKHGLIRSGGRPRLGKRHQLIIELMAHHAVTPADRMPRGFWSEALVSVSDSEGDSAPRDTQSVRQWWIDHKSSCAACLSARPTTQESVRKPHQRPEKA
jgi:hypothetical protein